MNRNDNGNTEEKSTEFTPFLDVATKLVYSPMRSNAPHPPVLEEIIPLRSTSASPLRKQHDGHTLAQLLHKPKSLLCMSVGCHLHQQPEEHNGFPLRRLHGCLQVER